jgi:hypothetical protein
MESKFDRSFETYEKTARVLRLILVSMVAYYYEADEASGLSMAVKNDGVCNLHPCLSCVHFKLMVY